TCPRVLPPVEDFEDGLGDWWVQRGVWEVGRPTASPDAAYPARNVPATVLDGNAYEGQDSMLVSPCFKVPVTNPALRFWHWFSFGGGDSGWVQVRPAGGDWETASDVYTGSSGSWTSPYIDLSKYAGLVVELAF